MTIRKVRPGRPQTVNPVPLQMSWQATGGDSRSVDLRFERTDAPGHPASEVRKLEGDRRLITTLHGQIVASVRPVGTPVFPDGTRIDFQLTTSGGPGGDEYAMPSVDVSGTQVAVLFSLTPEAGMWTLLVPVAGPTELRRNGVQEEGERIPLPLPPAPPEGLPVAQSASYRLRELAGPTGQVPSSSRAEIHLAIDRSASMLPHVRSGARHTLLELVLGVNAGVGLSSEIPVWHLGRSAEAVGRPLSNDTIDGFDEHLGEVPYTTGTALAPIIKATAGGSRLRLVIVITDGTPADLDDLSVELRAVEGSRNRWHLLVLARSSDDPEVAAEPWRDELSSLATVDSEHLSYSAITPGAGNGNWLESLLGDNEAGRDAMRRIVAGLAVNGVGE